MGGVLEFVTTSPGEYCGGTGEDEEPGSLLRAIQSM